MFITSDYRSFLYLFLLLFWVDTSLLQRYLFAQMSQGIDRGDCVALSMWYVFLLSGVHNGQDLAILLLQTALK